jgi:hypothetical protein
MSPVPNCHFSIFRALLKIDPVGFLDIFTRGILGCDYGLAKNLHSSQNRGAGAVTREGQFDLFSKRVKRVSQLLLTLTLFKVLYERINRCIFDKSIKLHLRLR